MFDFADYAKSYISVTWVYEESSRIERWLLAAVLPRETFESAMQAFTALKLSPTRDSVGVG